MSSFLDHGVLGALVLVLFVALWRQHRQISEIQEKRVELALKVADAAHVMADALDRNTAAIERAYGVDLPPAEGGSREEATGKTV